MKEHITSYIQLQQYVENDHVWCEGRSVWDKGSGGDQEPGAASILQSCHMTCDDFFYPVKGASFHSRTARKNADQCIYCCNSTVDPNIVTDKNGFTRGDFIRPNERLSTVFRERFPLYLISIHFTLQK